MFGVLVDEGTKRPLLRGAQHVLVGLVIPHSDEHTEDMAW